MTMKTKHEIEEKIARLEKHYTKVSDFLSCGMLEGRNDLQVQFDRRNRINQSILMLRWVLNKRK